MEARPFRPHDESEHPPALRLDRDRQLDAEAVVLFRRFCQREDPAIFDQLFERTATRLLAGLRLLVQRHGSATDPAELLTDVFAQVYRARNTFSDRNGRGFVRWFLTIAQNLLRQHHRERQRRDRREQLVANGELDHRYDPLEQLLRREESALARETCVNLREVVLAGLEQLSASHRQVVLLHTVHGLRYREIAHRLGLTTSAVAMRIKRSRERILGHLRAHYGLDDAECEVSAPGRDDAPTSREDRS